MKDILESLKKTKWPLMSLGLIGLFFILLSLTYLSDCKVFSTITLTLGNSLIIGTIVGCVIEFTEFAGYFEKRLSRYMIKHEFL